MTKRLLIIASDHVSEWINKGEVVDRYYNPENLFDEIHLLLINNDSPNVEVLKRMAGRAKVLVYNYPEPPSFFSKTFGWQICLINKWALGGVELIQQIRPDLIRSHGAHLNSFIASMAKEKLSIPYVVSLHINPDENFRKSAKSLKDKIVYYALKKIERKGLLNADLVLPVYKPIVPYLERMGVTKFKVCYNVLNDNFLITKKNYELSNPIKIVCVGRQFDQKDPSNIIKAIQFLPNVHLKLIGKGPLNGELKKLVKRLNLAERVEFQLTIDNDELCKSLHQFDFMILHTDHFEISKVMLESFLVGLPLLLNFRMCNQVPELNDNNCLRVENSIEGYRKGIKQMIIDHKLRREIGEQAYLEAKEKWRPSKCEEAVANVYKSFF